jgi:hypothetical protein
MATLQAADVDDLVATTLRYLNKGRATQIAQRLQHYEVMGRLMKNDKKSIDHGYEVQKDIMVDHSDASSMVGLFATDDVDVPAVMQQITVPFRHQTTNWAYDLREPKMNSGVAKIVDTVKVRRLASYIAMAEQMETQFWGVPTGTTDNLNVYGVEYWIVANATEGFNGGNHASFTSGPGGLSATTYTRWKNYTNSYTDITRDDLVRKMKKAYKKIRFVSPVGQYDFRRGAGQRYRIYMDEPIQTQLEELAENQNDRLGTNLASMDGITTFKGNPLVYVPKLDGVTTPTGPVYMFDMEAFYPVFMKGTYMTTTGPIMAPKQHMVREMHTDLSWNVVCDDRRRQAVLVTAV